MNINIPKKYLESLRFIIFQFINTHEESPDIYPKELEISKRILASLEKHT